MSDPKISDYAPMLVGMADSFAGSEPAHIDFDINRDGAVDSIDIKYGNGSYEFNVRFGQTANSPAPIAQRLQIPFSAERDDFNWKIGKQKHYEPGKDDTKYYSKDAHGKVTDQIDWNLVKEDYPQIVHMFFHPALRQNLPALALLMRSSDFRAQLKRSVDNGYRLLLNRGDGMSLNSQNKTILITPGISLTEFLFQFPHELAHQDVAPEDKSSIGSFINSYVMNEVRPDQFAFRVLKQLGIKVDEGWGYLGNLSMAYGKGAQALLKARKKHIDPQALTYVEKAYLLFQIPESDIPRYDTESETLAKPRIAMHETISGWQDYFQRKIEERQMSPEQILDSAEARALLEKTPDFAAHVKTHRIEWIQMINLLMTPASKGQTLLVRNEHQANLILQRLVGSYMEEGLERIRISNAQKLGIEQYY